MPDYDSPETLRRQEVWDHRWRAKFYPTSKPPNRRGDYENANRWNFRSKFHFRGKSVPRKWSPKKQRASANRSSGTRGRRRYNAARDAEVKGFQHAFVPMEKPKIPRRVLIDAQEEEIWRAERDG